MADSIKTSKRARADEAATVGTKPKNAGHAKSAETIQLEHLVESILTVGARMFGAHVKAQGRKRAIEL
eukprot:5476659-Pleurochrysis_carterae.AAC.1